MGDAVERADAASKAATKAIADVKATEAKLYPVAENVLKGTAKDTFIHVDDAFPSSLLGIEIEGATEQATTAGKNLLDYFKLSKLSSSIYAVENENLKVLACDGRAWNTVSMLMTLKAGTYCASGAYFEIRSESDNSDIFSGKGKFTLNKDTEVKVKVGTNLSSYPGVVKAQIEMGDTATAYEPYTGGKPSPSPDYPQEIKVVENPTVKVAGRNLFDDKYPAYIAAYNNGVAIINKYSYDKPSVVLPFTTGPRSSNGFGFIEKLKPDVTYTLKAFNSPDKSVVCIAGYRNVEDIGNPSNAVWHLKETSLGGPVSFSVKEGGECVVFTFAAEWGDGTNKITYPADFKATIEHGSTATDYKPYTSQSQVFTLPAEHPYLAKVDNKADEIRVDRDGNVELVARVGVDKNVRKVGAFQRGEYYSFNTNLSPFASQNEDYGGIMLCSTLQSRYLTSNGDGIYRTWNGVYVKDTSGRTKEEIQAEVDKNAPLTVVAKIPEKRYPLGKIEIPKAQDSIVNAWTDAEVTPRTGIEYTRDVNIVVANLESAIASITEG